MMNFVILLLTKHDISTTERKQKGREIMKAKESLNREPRRRRKRGRRKTENDTEFLGFNCLW